MYRVYIVEFNNGERATMLTDLKDSETPEGALNAAYERFGKRRVKSVHESEYQQRIKNGTATKRTDGN